MCLMALPGNNKITGDLGHTDDHNAIVNEIIFVKNSYSTLDSPSFTGTPLAPTASVNTNTSQIATTGFVVGQAGTASPLINGTASVGASLLYSRQDHVHPTDTTRAPLNSPAFTGTPSAPTVSAGDISGRIATTEFVANAVLAIQTVSASLDLSVYLRQDTASATYLAKNDVIDGGTP
jgi:hypothetical protein